MLIGRSRTVLSANNLIVTLLLFVAIILFVGNMRKPTTEQHDSLAFTMMKAQLVEVRQSLASTKKLLSMAESRNRKALLGSRNSVRDGAHHEGLVETHENAAALGSKSETNHDQNLLPRNLPKSDKIKPRQDIIIDSSIDALREKVRVINEEQQIHNYELFQPDLNNCPVLLVMLHNRYDYFKLFLESARGVDGISSALLIISADYYSTKLEDVLSTIDFMSYMLIFYQFSPQLYPNSFPGPDPNDCPRDISRAEAQQRKCNNANHPDIYGHYRESKFVVVKHHWTWKLSFVFNKIDKLASHDGPVVLLEEDHYLVPDMIQVLVQARLAVPNDGSSLLVLGGYQIPKSATSFASTKLQMTGWHSAQHNMGMVMTKQLFQQLQSCSAEYCSWDDYNWDFSFMHTGAAGCFGSTGLQAVMLAGPRVVHVGRCGVHAKTADCSVQAAAQDAQHVINLAQPALFPNQGFSLQQTPHDQLKVKANGGWGDIRDHDLCQKMLLGDKL